MFAVTANQRIVLFESSQFHQLPTFLTWPRTYLVPTVQMVETCLFDYIRVSEEIARRAGTRSNAGWRVVRVG